MKKILKIVVWDELNYSKASDMLRLSFKFHAHIDVVIGLPNTFDYSDYTIYVGYESTISNSKFKDLDITDNYINENCVWSFGYDEDRVLFGKYLKQFTTQMVNSFFSNNIKYVIIDYMFNDLGIVDVDTFISCFEGKIDMVFNTGLSFYFKLKSDDVIYNISMKMVKFYERDKLSTLISFMKPFEINYLSSYDNFKEVFSTVLDSELFERYYLHFITQ